MNIAQVAHIRAHVAAVARLVLGAKAMKPSLCILAGEELDALGRLHLAEMATESQIDLVYLAFAIDADGVPVMRGISLTLPRDAICYGWTDCQLALLPGRSRAVIVPGAEVGSHFKVLPGEIVQIRGRPATLAEGIDRAVRRLAMLVRDGVDVRQQIALHDSVEV